MTNNDPVFKKVAELLKTNRGIFIGEYHGQPVAQNFTISHFEELKKAGVTTIYVETDAYTAGASLRGSECLLKHLLGTHGIGEEAIKEALMRAEKEGLLKKGPMMSIVINAAAAGLRVIGHDSVMQTIDGISRKDKEGMPLEIMNQRDQFAKELIERTWDGGKFIVYGGAWHSGNEKGDAGRTSIDALLNIPSVDFHKIFFPDKRYSSIAADKSGASTYQVQGADDAFKPSVLPADTAEGKEHLAAAAKAPSLLGDSCKLPSDMRGKTMLDTQDIENIAKFVNKPPASNTPAR